MSLQTVPPDLKGQKRRLSYDEGQQRGFFAGLMSRMRRKVTSPALRERVPSPIQEYQMERTIS